MQLEQHDGPISKNLVKSDDNTIQYSKYWAALLAKLRGEWNCRICVLLLV